MTPISATSFFCNEAASVNRREAKFHPSVWGDHFLSYSSNSVESTETEEEEEARKLKEEVKATLTCAAMKPSQKLDLIDSIQRLGVARLFGHEIEQVLSHIFIDFNDDTNLQTTALRFRLLRQHGYNVSCDVFNVFKDGKGKFKESLINDSQALLSFYEASHLRTREEDVLEEALAFTTHHLDSLAAVQRAPFSVCISRALKRPIRKSLPRLEARKNFSLYEANSSLGKLLRLAKLDFNRLQKLHQRELSDITKWWKDLDFAVKLPFARDRLVECYFWILGMFFEPEYSLARKILTKVIAMTSTMDDIYDAYGTFEELKLFTEAVQRWNIGAMDMLPEYMRIFYQALLDVYSEIEKEMDIAGKSYRVDRAKNAMKNQARAYFEEAKWFHNQQTPTIEEYMEVALVSSGYSLLATTSFVAMGDIATEDALKWVSGRPKIVRSSELIARLMDDMVGHKHEQERGHVASSVECYMKQHGTAEEETISEFCRQIEDAWKDINQECLQPMAVPMPLLEPVLNLAHVMDVVYKDEDGYTHSGGTLKDLVATLLVDSVAI